MNIPLANDVPHLWETDGSLRDVYVRDTSIQDWKKFLEYVSSFQRGYSFDGVAGPIPDIEEIFSNRDGAHLFNISLGHISVNCHFFVDSEIELDIDPKEVKGAAEHAAVLNFVAGLARALGKTTLVAPENGIEIPFLSYDPIVGTWAIHG